MPFPPPPEAVAWPIFRKSTADRRLSPNRLHMSLIGPLAKAEFKTIQMRLIKLGACIRETASRVGSAFASACPEADLFASLVRCFQCGAFLRYQIGTSLPEHDIPFVAGPIDATQQRMQRAALLRTDGTRTPVKPLAGFGRTMFEEEFSDAGLEFAQIGQADGDAARVGSFRSCSQRWRARSSRSDVSTQT